MRTRAVLFTAALVVLGACSDDDDAGDTTTAAQADGTSTTRPATTTTARPETTAARPTTTSAPEDDATDTTDESATDTSDENGTDTKDDDASTDVSTLEDRLDTIEEALEDGDFSFMLEALNLSGLAEDIEQNEVTILAPTDEAFGELDVRDYAELLTDPEELQDIVNRHIIDEVLTFDELSERTEVTTTSGQTLQVTFEEGVLEVGGAVVTERENAPVGDDQVQEFAVFAIDRVLLEVR